MGGAPSSPEARHEPLPLPVWVRVSACMRYLELSGSMHHEGIYRVPGSSGEIHRALQYFHAGGSLSPSDLPHNAWASAIKSLLRAYAPITGYDMFDSLMAGAAVGEAALLAVCAALPALAQARLDFVSRHLVRVARCAATNKMPVANLARFWGSILARPNEEPAVDIGRELAQGSRQTMFAQILLTFYDRVMPFGDEPEAVQASMIPIAPPLFASYGISMFGDGASHVRSVDEAVTAWRASRRPSQEHVWRSINTEEFTSAVAQYHRERTGQNARTGGKAGPVGFARSMFRRISVFGANDAAAQASATTTPPVIANSAGLRRAVSESEGAIPPPASFMRRASNLFGSGGGKSGRPSTIGSPGDHAGMLGSANVVAGAPAASGLTEEEELAAWERQFGNDDDAGSLPAPASLPAADAVEAVIAPPARGAIFARRGVPGITPASVAEFQSPWGFTRSNEEAPSIPPLARQPLPTVSHERPPSLAQSFEACVSDRSSPPSSRAPLRSGTLSQDSDESPVLRRAYPPADGTESDDDWEAAIAGDHNIVTGPRRHAPSNGAPAAPGTHAGAAAGRVGAPQLPSSSGSRRVSIDVAPMLSPGTVGLRRSTASSHRRIFSADDVDLVGHQVADAATAKRLLDAETQHMRMYSH